jgi:hypothetical protein
MKSGLSAPILLGTLFLAGCKSGPPQIAGKWHGSDQLNASYSTTLNPRLRAETAPAEISLVLMQTGGNVQGEATVVLFKDSTYRIALRTVVVGKDGKVNLEGDSDSTMSKAHFSFDGLATEGKLTGTVGFGFSNVGGKADSNGQIQFSPAQ